MWAWVDVETALLRYGGKYLIVQIYYNFRLC